MISGTKSYLNPFIEGDLSRTGSFSYSVLVSGFFINYSLGKQKGSGDF